MAVVTDKQYYLDNKLIEKLDLMIERTNQKMDNLVLIDGDEGLGKSNLAAGICYYFAWKTGRKFDVDNVFFELDGAIDFARKTNEQIIDWDEGALGGLAAEWWRKNQLEFIKLLMIGRKKRHFFVVCIPKFFKLNEYLVVDRSIALLHVYARNEIQRGRFVYYGKNKKESLFNAWKRTKKRTYKKYYDFRGSFLEYLPKVIDEVAYEAKKDDAILNFKKAEPRLTEGAKNRIARATEGRIVADFIKNCPEIPKKDIAKGLGITSDLLSHRIKAYNKALSAEK